VSGRHWWRPDAGPADCGRGWFESRSECFSFFEIRPRKSISPPRAKCYAATSLYWKVGMSLSLWPPSNTSTCQNACLNSKPRPHSFFRLPLDLQVSFLGLEEEMGMFMERGGNTAFFFPLGYLEGSGRAGAVAGTSFRFMYVLLGPRM